MARYLQPKPLCFPPPWSCRQPHQFRGDNNCRQAFRLQSVKIYVYSRLVRWEFSITEGRSRHWPISARSRCRAGEVDQKTILLQHWDYNPPLRFRLENLDRLLGTRNADFAAAWLWEFADSGADTFDGCDEADDAHEPQNNKLPSGAVLDPNTVQALRQARQIREHSMEVAQGPF